ncbi:MAG: sulfurtransferase TusA family protein [Gammaproteobacteria bacterium]
MNEEFLDARRLLCPLPVIRVQDRVKRMKPGERLKVVCTDPGALHDIPAWCRINGHAVVSTEDGKGEISILLEVGG